MGACWLYNSPMGVGEEISFKDTRGKNIKILSLKEPNPTQTAISRNLWNIWGQFNSLWSFEYGGREGPNSRSHPWLALFAAMHARLAGLWVSETYLYLPSCHRNTGLDHLTTPGLMWVLGIQTQVLKLVQVLYPMSHHPSQILKL